MEQRPVPDPRAAARHARQPARIRPREDAEHPQRRAGRQKLRSEDSVERATLDEREMQYLYQDGDDYYFMDTTTYEQIHISSEALGDSVDYLKPEMTINVEFYGTEPVGIELPPTVDLKVIDTAPGHQGRDREQPDQAGDARNGSGRQRAAVHQPRRHDSRQHRKPASTQSRV